MDEPDSATAAETAPAHAQQGYALGPDEGEALWFNGALGILKATAALTGGRYTVYELRARKDFAAPLHAHAHEDELFLVISGEVRLQHGDQIVKASSGSLAYTPRGVGHSFRVDSEQARLLLFFGPAGVEEFFREAGQPARSLSLPPPDEPVPARDMLVALMQRHGQTLLGPPLPAAGEASSPR